MYRLTYGRASARILATSDSPKFRLLSGISIGHVGFSLPRLSGEGLRGSGASRGIPSVNVDVFLGKIAAPGAGARRAEVEMRANEHFGAAHLRNGRAAIEILDLPVSHQPHVADRD